MIPDPTPTRIAKARKHAGDSATGAAARVRVTRGAWLHWESGRRPMPWAAWELYMIATSQHPLYRQIAQPSPPSEPAIKKSA